MFVNFVFIALGGAMGSVLRYGVSLLLPHNGRLPWATFAVNVVGSFIIGVVLANVSRGDARHLFGVVGFCGAFTTFSAFSVETFEMIKNAQWASAAGYAALSVLMCVGAVALGSLVKFNN